LPLRGLRRLFHQQHGDIQRAPAEVEHEVHIAWLEVDAVAQRGGGRLVDQAQAHEPRRLRHIEQPVLVMLVRLYGHGAGDFLVVG
jgi:NAD-specific glutamate dehydrogenase.